MDTDSQWIKQETCFVYATQVWLSQRIKQETCFAYATQVWLAVNHTPVALLANEFDVLSVLHRQVSLAAVNQMYVFHVAKNLKIH